jgi:hypothetical protein
VLLRRSNIPGNIQYINRRLDRTAGWQAACKHERHYGHLQYAHVETEKIYGPHHAAANTQAAWRVLHFGPTSLPVAPPRCQPRQEPPLDLVVGNATPGGARPRGSASAATAPAVAGALRRQWLEPKAAPVSVDSRSRRRRPSANEQRRRRRAMCPKGTKWPCGRSGDTARWVSPRDRASWWCAPPPSRPDSGATVGTRPSPARADPRPRHIRREFGSIGWVGTRAAACWGGDAVVGGEGAAAFSAILARILVRRLSSLPCEERCPLPGYMRCLLCSSPAAA